MGHATIPGHCYLFFISFAARNRFEFIFFAARRTPSREILFFSRLVFRAKQKIKKTLSGRPFSEKPAAGNERLALGPSVLESPQAASIIARRVLKRWIVAEAVWRATVSSHGPLTIKAGRSRIPGGGGSRRTTRGRGGRSLHPKIS